MTSLGWSYSRRPRNDPHRSGLLVCSGNLTKSGFRLFKMGTQTRRFPHNLVRLYGILTWRNAHTQKNYFIQDLGRFGTQ